MYRFLSFVHYSSFPVSFSSSSTLAVLLIMKSFVMVLGALLFSSEVWAVYGIGVEVAPRGEVVCTVYLHYDLRSTRSH